MDESVRQMIEQEVQVLVESEEKMFGRALSISGVTEIRKELFEIYEAGQWNEVFGG